MIKNINCDSCPCFAPQMTLAAFGCTNEINLGWLPGNDVS